MVKIYACSNATNISRRESTNANPKDKLLPNPAFKNKH